MTQQDGRRIAVESQRGIQRGILLGVLVTHGTGVVAFLPDGRRLAAYSSWRSALNELWARRRKA